MDNFYYCGLNEKLPEEIALENAVNSALNFFEQRDFPKSLLFLSEAIEICEKHGVGIPNLYLMRAYAEMETGELENALISINCEIDNFPQNTRAYELKSRIEFLIDKKISNPS